MTRLSTFRKKKLGRYAIPGLRYASAVGTKGALKWNKRRRGRPTLRTRPIEDCESAFLEYLLVRSGNICDVGLESSPRVRHNSVSCNIPLVPPVDM